MKKCLIVDGHNLLFQMFFGMPARIFGKDNTPIQGVVGFIGALIKTINATGTDTVIAIFDNEQGSGRNEVNPDYKTNRPVYTDIPDEESPFPQLPYIQQALDYMGIYNAEAASGYEADDVIAGYCLKENNTDKIIIMSNDADFLQLVNERVSVYKYRGKKSELFDESKVKEKFGITPAQIAYYKTLAGDSSDNIKGVPGIGHKTAVRLLNEYGSIENIFNNLQSVKPTRISTALNEYKEIVQRDLSIIKLDGGAVLPFDIDKIERLHNTENMRTMEILKGIGLI